MALARIKTWVSGEVLLASDLNSEFNNLLNNSLTLISPLTASLNAGGFKITNYGGTDVPSARSDVPIVSQVQDRKFTWCGTAGGTANALTLTPSPAITSYIAGQRFAFKAGSTGNATATTVAVSGLATAAIQVNGIACAGGEIAPDDWYEIEYDGAAFQLKSAGVDRTGDIRLLDFIPVALHAGIVARTNTTDLTPYLILAMNAMFSATDLDTNKTLQFPFGELLFTSVNPFGQWSVTTAARRHVTFVGRGAYSTLIRFKPGGSAAAYLYNGETDGGGAARDQQLLFVLFEKLGFVFDETGMSGGSLNLAKQFPKSGAPNQNFQFRDCYFLGPSTAARAGTVLLARGTINASENSFHNCRASQMLHIIDSTNPQSVDHYVYGCDWDSGVGDIYVFTDGGQLSHVGGSVTWSPTSDSYIINANASVGGLTTSFNFYGLKVESNTVNALIANASGVNNAARITFRDCDFATMAGVSRTAVSVQPNAPCSVLFDRCNLNPSSGGPLLYEFKAGTANYWLGLQYNGLIEFQRCQLPLDVHSRFSWGANSNGLFRIRHGRSGNTWTPDTDPNIAWDCDLLNGTPAHSPSSPGPEPKSVWGMIYSWPDSGANTDGARTRIKLPVDSIIKAIKVHRIAFGATGTAWSLAITNDDGTFTYGIIAAGAQNVVMDFADPAVWRRATSGVNQYIRVVTVKQLAYNTQTVNFTVGATLTDGTTSTTAKILADSDAGATGTLTLGFITGGTGLFGVGNIITDGSGGSATAGATTSLQGSNLQRAMAAGDIYAVEYY